MRYDLRSRKHSSSGEESVLSSGANRPPRSAPSKVTTRATTATALPREPRVLRKRHSTTNAFRVAEDDELEGILLFKEKPRQFLLLFIVILAVWYYSYTHDSEVRQTIFAYSPHTNQFIILPLVGTGEKRSELNHVGQFYLSQLLFLANAGRSSRSSASRRLADRSRLCSDLSDQFSSTLGSERQKCTQGIENIVS